MFSARRGESALELVSRVIPRRVVRSWGEFQFGGCLAGYRCCVRFARARCRRRRVARDGRLRVPARPARGVACKQAGGGPEKPAAQYTPLTYVTVLTDTRVPSTDPREAMSLQSFSNVWPEHLQYIRALPQQILAYTLKRLYCLI